MTNFPTTFNEESLVLDPNEFDTEEPVVLESRGYNVSLGLTKSDAEKLSDISKQPSIKEYCPRDCSTRFKDLSSTESWLAKGHQVYLLKEKSSGEIAGYAWSGNGTSPHIPEGSITCALRLNENFQGQGLATPFFAVVIAHTKKTYPGETIWLEGWESNLGAIHVYKKLGFKLVASEESTRPALNGETIQDTRLFMTLSGDDPL